MRSNRPELVVGVTMTEHLVASDLSLLIHYPKPQYVLNIIKSDYTFSMDQPLFQRDTLIIENELVLSESILTS